MYTNIRSYFYVCVKIYLFGPVDNGPDSTARVQTLKMSTVRKKASCSQRGSYMDKSGWSRYLLGGLRSIAMTYR